MLYSKLRPYLNKVIVADADGYCTTEILAFNFGQHIAAQYAKTFFMSPYFVDYAMDGAYGVKMPRIGSHRGNSALMPVPPYTEQIHLVNRIDELFEQIDIIEQNQTDIDTLYDEFRKRTLTLAIQGKLVPQNPNDEPASVLLERIRAEKKAKLGKKYVDSYIYKSDDNCYYEKVGETVTNISDEMPFDLPENWAWIRLGYIIDFSKSDTVIAIQIDPSSWVLDLEDIEKDSGRLLQKKAMGETQSKSDKYSFSKGNVLYSKLRPYLNKVIVADDDGYCTTEILAFDFGQYIAAQYAQMYFMSEATNLWYPVDPYNMDYETFKHSTDSVAYLTSVFLDTYERPADPEATRWDRQQAAQYWYNYLAQYDPGTPPTPAGGRKKMPLWMMCQPIFRRRRY